MSHTPGPWEWDTPTSDYIIGKDVDSNMFVIASVSEYILVGDKDSNAALIAAAPDLLAACKLTLEAICNDDDGWTIENVESACFTAIAKAEGE